MEEIIKFKGIFDLELYKDDILVDKIYDDNIIVSSAFTIISSLLSKGTTSNRISILKLGNGGIYNSVIKIPLTTETDLYNPLESKQINNDIADNSEILIDPINKLIIFTWIFDTHEANGTGARIYNEAGLFSESGIMFSKKNFKEVVKTTEKKMIVKWTITIG